jgi:excisionase family DNA binding protein
MSRINDMSPRTFLKPSEVASLLNVSMSTVYSWYRTEMIRGVKIGGCVRIYQHSLGGSSVARESGPTRTILTSIE